MACLSHHQHAAVDDERQAFAEPGVRPHYAPDRTVRIVHARVSLSLEPAQKTFRGKATFDVSPLPTFSGDIEFDLDEVTVTSVTNGDGVSLPFVHADAKLQITTGSDSPHLRVTIEWHGSNPVHGLYFTGPTAEKPGRDPMAWTQCQDEDAHFVFPCHDHPGVKHPWSLEVDAPAGHVLLSNGRRVREWVDEGRAHATFEMTEPMPAYLVTFVAAKLSIVDQKWRGVEVRYLVPRGEEAHAVRGMGRTPAMMEFLSKRLGVDYPWPRYDQVVVHDFVFGGMENTACTTMTDLLLVDERGELEFQPDGLVVHELGHQWFGDLVTCQDWSQGWLNESWATYCEALWWEETRDAAEATWYRFATAKGYFEEAAGKYRRPIVSYDFREPIDVFDRHLYNKGSCVLWTLRHELGEDAFWTGVKHYLSTNRHQPVHTRQFQRSLEVSTGKNLDGFFDRWIFHAGHPVLEVKLAAETDKVTVTVSQKQSGDGVPDRWELQLRLELVASDGTQVVDLPVREREQVFVLPVKSAPHTIRVDPGFRVLAEISLKGSPKLLRALLDDPCPVLAIRAATAVADDGSPAALGALRATLRTHPFPGVRGHIASLLADRATTGDRDALISALEAEAEPRARRQIGSALGRFRDPKAADALLAALAANPATWHLHGALLVALGQTRDPRAVAAISAHLDTPGWADHVRQRALVALAETESDDAFEPIAQRASRELDDRVRAAAAAALARLAEGNRELRKRIAERLMAMLPDPGLRAQVAAITALGTMREPLAAPALTRLHRSAPDGRTRRTAFEALTKIRRGSNTDEALTRLSRRVEQLADENAKLRERLDRLDRLGK